MPLAGSCFGHLQDGELLTWHAMAVGDHGCGDGSGGARVGDSGVDGRGGHCVTVTVMVVVVMMMVAVMVALVGMVGGGDGCVGGGDSGSDGCGGAGGGVPFGLVALPPTRQCMPAAGLNCLCMESR